MVFLETILPFIGILLGLIVLHELGHFITAKLAGVRVEEFGIGLPPRIGKGWQFGETLYSFNWLPIGGFVRLTGEEASGLLVTAVDPEARTAKFFNPGDRITHVDGKRVVAPDQFVGRVLLGLTNDEMEIVYDQTDEDGRKKSWKYTLRHPDDSERPEQDFTWKQIERYLKTDQFRERYLNETGGEGSVIGLTVGIDPRSLGAKSRLTRIAILAAGAGVNAILPFLLFAIGALIPDNVPAGPALVTGIVEGAPAAEAGIRPGDKIIAVNGEEIRNATDLARTIQLNMGEDLAMTIERDPPASITDAATTRAEPEQFVVHVHARLAPQPLEHIVQQGESVHDIAERLGVSAAQVIAAWGVETEELREGVELQFPGGHTYVTEADDTMLSIAAEEGVRMTAVYAALGLDPLYPTPGAEISIPQGATGINIANASTRIERRGYSFGASLAQGWHQTADTFVLVRNRIRSWVAGGDPIELSGPVGIARVTGEVVDRAGWTRLIELAALISLNLAIINILPLPMLDGGRIMFVLIEIARRGKRISPEREGLVHLAGFAALLIFIVVISYFDIIKAISGESVLR